MRRPNFVARQAAHPSGLLGRLVVGVMERETASENDAAIRALDIRTADRVLEIGFGHGRTLPRLVALAPRGSVVGIEISEDMVERARRRLRTLVATGAVEISRADAASIPYPDSSFDRILSVHTLYFWSDPGVVLREIARVAKRGARLVLGYRPGNSRIERDFPSSVYRFYDPGEVTALLESSGFSSVTVERAAERGCLLSVATRDPS
jgi:SAM-dependent methyltransferase